VTANEARPDVIPSSADGSEEPLLSGGGRAFLDGKIDANEYVEAARRTAAALARREVNSDVSRERGRLRKVTEGVLFFAAAAYGILGIIVLSVGSESLTVGATAFVTGVAFAILGVTLPVHFRKKDRGIANFFGRYPEDRM
jgi:hypothetical protein